MYYRCPVNTVITWCNKNNLNYLVDKLNIFNTDEGGNVQIKTNLEELIETAYNLGETKGAIDQINYMLFMAQTRNTKGLVIFQLESENTADDQVENDRHRLQVKPGSSALNQVEIVPSNSIEIEIIDLAKTVVSNSTLVKSGQDCHL